MNTVNYINEKIQNAKELDFGTIFNEAIELFKKTWVQGLLAQVFMMLIVFPIILILYIPIITMAIAQSESGQYNPEAMSGVFAGFSFLYVLMILVLIIALSAMAGAIGAGLYRVIKKIDHEETVVTKDLFYFFKGRYIGKLLVIMLLSVLISIPAALACYIPLLYVLVPLSLLSPIFAFNSHLSVGDLFSSAFKLGNKKWLLLFGLIMISSILAQIVGMLACGIGVLVTAPFVYHPVYLVYKKVVGFGDEDKINDIGRIEA